MIVNNCNILMIFDIKEKMKNFDPYNVLLAIATNVPVLLKPCFVVQSHISDCPCHYRTTDVCVLVSVCMSSQQTAEPGPTSHLFSLDGCWRNGQQFG